MNAIDLSILVPCYNEEASLPELHRRLTAICAQKLPVVSYEIMLINDGSTDGSWTLMSQLALRDTHIVAINLSRNGGQQISLTAGLRECCGNRALIIDADLQDPPELLPRMMELMDEGYDLVRGKRLEREGESRFKRGSASLFYRLLNFFSDVDIPLDTGEFRLMNRKVIDALNAVPETGRFIRGLCAWVGFRQTELSYKREKRFSGETHYTVAKMAHLAIDAITGFSVRPLRLTFYFGMLLALIGGVLLLYVLSSWLRHDTVPGWTSIAALIIILQSIQFIFLGIFGEYLAKIFTESKRRPLYFINGVIRNGREE